MKFALLFGDSKFMKSRVDRNMRSTWKSV